MSLCSTAVLLGPRPMATSQSRAPAAVSKKRCRKASYGVENPAGAASRTTRSITSSAYAVTVPGAAATGKGRPAAPDSSPATAAGSSSQDSGSDMIRSRLCRDAPLISR